MPFARPTRSELIAQVAADISAGLLGADALLRYTSLQITGKAQAGMAHGHYGYLDWIAKQAVPFTSTDEYLAGWGALRNIFKKPATAAQLTVSFTGSAGAVLDAGSTIARGDGVEYVSEAEATVGSAGTLAVTVTAVDAGTAANSAVGVVMTLSTAVAGIQSTGAVTAVVSEGTDVEAADDFRTRVMAAFQKTPQGGDADDYVTWVTAVPGVTRAWVKRNGMGAGTVVIYIMLDNTQAANNGFPQGTDGVATNESRGTTATGDQLTAADAIFPKQPVTALVYVVSPIPNPIPFTITGLTNAPVALRASIAAAITDVFFRLGDPTGSIVNLSSIETAIGALSGTDGFVIETPSENIVSAAGYIPTLGTVTFP